jgi:dolichyl-phosphate beta-glucosyltransferase
MVDNPELSIVVPAYNAASFIASTAHEALTFCDEFGIEGELLIVDDGSPDGTSDAVPADPRTRVIRLAQNSGKGAAVRAGMLATRGSICVFTDAELPYGMQPVLLAVHYIRQRRFHAVVGDRTLPGSVYDHASLPRRIISSTASMTLRTLLIGGIFDTQCGFKAFRGDVAREIFSLSRINGFAIDVELLYLLLKYRLDIKRMRVKLRLNGPSTVRILRDTVRSGSETIQVRLNWFRGLYKSNYLEQCLERDLQNDQCESVEVYLREIGENGGPGLRSAA